MTNYIDGIGMVTEECCKCGIPFAMTQDFKNRRLRDRATFYCPSGHGQVYCGESKETRLKNQLRKRERELSEINMRNSQLRSERNQLSRAHNRMRDRVKNGVCPCCNRTFQNLMDHMRDKHPEFGSTDILKSLRDVYGLTQAALATEAHVSVARISKYENQKPLSDHAKTKINAWIESNA